VFPRGKPRIILIIDDLDRCSDDIVVQAIEALQLLVKTEQFLLLCLPLIHDMCAFHWKSIIWRVPILVVSKKKVN